MDVGIWINEIHLAESDQVKERNRSDAELRRDCAQGFALLQAHHLA